MKNFLVLLTIVLYSIQLNAQKKSKKSPEPESVVTVSGDTTTIQYTYPDRIRTIIFTSKDTTSITKNKATGVSDTVISRVVRPVSDSGLSMNKYLLIVTFISKGEGIDSTTKINFDKWLVDTYGNSKYVSWTVITWSNEGELDYCFDLSKCSPLQIHWSQKM